MTDIFKNIETKKQSISISEAEVNEAIEIEKLNKEIDLFNDYIKNLPENFAYLIYGLCKYSDIKQFYVNSSNNYADISYQHKVSLLYSCFVLMDINIKFTSYVSHYYDEWNDGVDTFGGENIPNIFIINRDTKNNYSEDDINLAWSVLKGFGYNDKNFSKKVESIVEENFNNDVEISGRSISCYDIEGVVSNTDNYISPFILESITEVAKKEMVRHHIGIGASYSDIEVYLDKPTVIKEFDNDTDQTESFELPHSSNNFQKIKLSTGLSKEGEKEQAKKELKNGLILGGSILFITFLCVLFF